MTDLPAFFGALALLVAAAALARQVARWVGQPPVLGELVLGIALGPTLLGAAWPAGHRFLLGGGNAPLLDALAWIGLALFMLSVGAQMHWAPRHGVAASGIALGGLLLPGMAGVAVATARPDWFFDGPPDGARILLVATLMTVTALPILARLLSDLGLLATPTAAVTLGAATIDDVVGWGALAVATAAGQSGLTGNLATNLLLVAGLLALALVADRSLTPLLRPAIPKDPAHFFVLVLAATFGAAILTDAAGLPAVVGALAVGAVVSRHPQVRDDVVRRLDGLAWALFLPLFFILTVGEADLGLVANAAGLVALAVVLAAASLGKVVGCYLGARAMGLGHAQGLACGILMNARGAVGLVVAKVGLDAGLLAPRGFALVVLVIVLTTLLAAPWVSWHVRRVGAAAL